MLGMRGVGHKTPYPDAVRTGRLKTSRLTTNSTLICVLSFRAREFISIRLQMHTEPSES